VELSLSARRDELVIDHLRAADGSGGHLDITGTLRMNPSDGVWFAMDIDLRDFRLIHHDLANVTALGALNWKGSFDESRLSGQLRMNPVELRIPERLPPALIPLEVIEIHEITPEIDVPVERQRSSNHRVLLDLKLEAPDRVHVRGNGLDSEWSARLRLKGDSNEPKLMGTIDLLRGRFLFFGRRMLLTRGRVQFDGAYPPDPLLDVAVELRGGGILGILEVRGPSSAPEIQLSSQPMLPEDEILARLLFGRESARITPWQALTLAQALNRLRGGGSTFDFMGETRRILRVDQVEVRSDEEAGSSSITVGRYLSDRIYVELERGIATEAGRARVEVELTPQLRLETETGGMTDTGIGIIWTRDY
jgi:autotransporter translocation and assembly factor TamB